VGAEKARMWQASMAISALFAGTIYITYGFPACLARLGRTETDVEHSMTTDDILPRGLRDAGLGPFCF
jgi:hypothetical protein